MRLESEPNSSAAPAASDAASNQGIRYWPVLANLLLTTAALLYIWLQHDGQRADLVIATFFVATVSSIWFLIWLLFRSRISPRPKWITFSIICGLAAATAGSFKIKGYTGDLVPIIRFRWSGDSSSGRANLNGTSAKSGRLVEAAFDPADYRWPQFLGPERNGVVRNLKLDPDWKSRPPVEIWRRAIGEQAGFSSFAVDAERVFTQQQEGERELVVCYDLQTGAQRWKYSHAARYESELGGVGPRATPAVSVGRIYAYGATGILSCLDANSGKMFWRRNVVDEHTAEVLEWGNSCSPLLFENLVIVSTGARKSGSSTSDNFATLAAYDKTTGDPVWSTGSDSAGYASPVFLRLAGVPQIVMVNAGSVTGHEPKTGVVLWTTDLEAESPSVSQPVACADDRLLICKGYGVGGKLIQILRHGSGAFDAVTKWKWPRVMQTKYTSAVIHGGYAYALSDGKPECIDVATGKRRWKARGDYNHGQILLIGDLILVQCEGGDVALVEANPKKLVEVARFTAFDYRTWNSPVVAGNLLLVRNDQEIACFALPMISVPNAVKR